MASKEQQYCVNDEIAEFFAKTSTIRSVCESRAEELVGCDVQMVPIQGCCSYTVYAGSNADTVVQFRLKSLALPLETARLARCVYGSLAPEVDFKGQLGEDEEGKEALYIYVMPRMAGISYLDFILAHGTPDDSPELCAKWQALLIDVARFFAPSWKSPQVLDQSQLNELKKTYEKDLLLLLDALPGRFHPLIERCREAIPSIMRLPLVLTHHDFSSFNIMVNNECHLTGVIDWAEATIEPFGIVLYTVEDLTGKFHLRNGYTRYSNYESLHDAFWSTLKKEVGGWSDETFHAIQMAMVLGLLLTRGFKSRLGNPSPAPIVDDESGAYNMLNLDSHLIRPETRFI